MLSWDSAPTSRKEVRKRLDAIISEGAHYPIPTGGCGAPGVELERLLGLDSRNKDNADSNGLEVKFYSGSSMVTLFHLECDKNTIDGVPAMVAMVKGHGWLDEKGRLSFRHTIRGQSELFKVTSRSGLLSCKPRSGKGPGVEWAERKLQTKAIQKLGRVALVHGVVSVDGDNTRVVKYTNYSVRDDIVAGEDFIKAILSGIVAIDFDAREKEPGSQSLRNHGTKFRVACDNFDDLWGR